MSIGIDFGYSQLKLVSLEPVKGNSFKYVTSHLLNHKFNWLSQRKVDIKEMKSAINEVWSKLKLTTNQVNTSLSNEQGIYLKLLKRPPLSDMELNSVLKFELEQFIPLPIDKIYYSFVRLGRIIEDKKNKELILVAAAPRDVVNQFLNFTTNMGLVVEVLETSMTALARSLTANKSKPVVILDLAASRFGLGIGKNGLLYTNHQMDISSMALTRLLSQTLNVDLAQAEQIKTEYGLDKKQFQGKVADILSSPVEQVVDAIKRAVAFYEDKIIPEKVSEIMVTGGGAAMPGLISYLSDKTGLEVSLPIFDKLAGLPEEIAKAPHLYAQAIGLAMRGFD